MDFRIKQQIIIYANWYSIKKLKVLFYLMSNEILRNSLTIKIN